MEISEDVIDVINEASLDTICKFGNIDEYCDVTLTEKRRKSIEEALQEVREGKYTILHRVNRHGC